MASTPTEKPVLYNEMVNLFRSLRHRNYRAFFFGQGVSVLGTWMQQTALAWLVYRMTGSVFLLGAVSFADKIAVSLLTPFAGAWIDRSSRLRIVLIAQALLLALAAMLAGLTLSGAIEVWHILALSFLTGVINAVDIPARQALVVQLLRDRADLGNAIALNSTLFNGARLIGPAVAGLLIGFTSEGFCFLINAVSYMAVIVALLEVRLETSPGRSAGGSIWSTFREGWSYAFGSLPTRSILLLLAIVSLMGVPFSVLLPVFANRIYGGGADYLGYLMAATGAGAMLGAVFLAARKTVRGLGKWIVFSSALFAAAIAAFSLTRQFWLALGLLALAGFGMMVHMASSNTILQTIVDEDKRGRVMSYYVLAISGMAPFGSLLTGALASHLGAPATLQIGAVCCLLGTLAFARALPQVREHIRPIYERMGIAPLAEEPVEAGLEAATEIETLER